MARGSSSLRVVGSLVLVVALIGVRVWLRSTRSNSSSNPNVTSVSQDDAAMNGAIARSRQSVQQFIQHLAHHDADETGFAIKIAVHDNGTTEHFWLAETSYDGSSFHGKIDDTPEAVENVKMGQSMSCLPSEVSDWMYIKNGVLVGGESIRVLRDSMSPSERIKFDREVPFKFN